MSLENLQRLCVIRDTAKLTLDERNMFDSFVLGWISGTIDPKVWEEALMKALDQVERTRLNRHTK